jgi:hypothetical protein
MPILVDFNQIAISSLMAQMGPKEVANFTQDDMPLLRHIILNALRASRVKFHNEFGELIICTDNKSWRKEVFPFYKAKRHSDRQESATNWSLIFDFLYDLKRELEEAFPYRVLSISGAEADDIIAVLCEYYATNELTGATALSDGEPQPILILSGDKDFAQLQRYPNVKQYSPIFKKWIKVKDPELALREHIVRGDVGDGVPNFRSPDNCLAEGVRQKAIMEKKLTDYLHKEPKDFCANADEARWFVRNTKLIDFRFIPPNVKETILERYHGQTVNSRRGLLDYFIKHRMRNMLECVGDF